MFATAIQYNMTETGYRYIVYCVVGSHKSIVLGGQEAIPYANIEVGTYIVAAYFYKSDYMYVFIT